jgi:hypothetical protein
MLNTSVMSKGTCKLVEFFVFFCKDIGFTWWPSDRVGQAMATLLCSIPILLLWLKIH